MLSDLVLILCGVVLILTAALVLATSHSVEISTRSAAGLLFGVAGAWCVARALMGPPAPMADLALPAGVSIWLLGAMWRRRGRPMRRASDWNDEAKVAAAVAAAVDRSPWLPAKE